MKSQLQLNGLVILYSYLQRIFVYDTVLAKFGVEASKTGGQEVWHGYLEQVGKAIAGFDTDTGLNEADQARMIEISEAASAAMRARRADPDAQLPGRLAAVAGDLYCGQHRNNGLVYWGDKFDEAVADRYRQQIPTHWNTTNTISGYVAKALEGSPLPEADEARLATWFASTCKLVSAVDDDLAQTARLLAGERPV
jgi:hypothetical protein